MRIDDSMLNAIQSAVHKYGSVLSFANAVGVSHTTVNFWLKGRTARINAQNWNALLPVLEEFLPPQPQAHSMRESSAMSAYAINTPNKIPEVFLLQFPELEFLTSSKQVPDFTHCTNTASFTASAGKHAFAVEVDQAHAGYFHPGTLLLLDWGTSPENGDFVLACRKRKTRKYLFARYYCTEKTMLLKSPDSAQSETSEHSLSRISSEFAWIVPVREAVMPL